MAAIELRILGTLDLRKAEGGEIHSLVAQPKRIALLTFLCLGSPRGFHRRDSILGLFWPEADQTHARTSLRNSLHMLRRSLGDNAILTRGDEEVSANFDLVRCDATAFDDLTAAEKWEEGLALYRGDLLPGFFLEDVPFFERWLEAERLRLRGSAARGARIVAERRESQQHLTEAVTWARRAVQLTDTDERAVRRLLELLTRVGDRAGALQAYEDFARHLANEYDSEPSAETRGVIDKLRTGTSAPRLESTPKAAAATPSASSSSQPIAGYEIKRELGHGGTSTVFLARDLKHDRDVAIKILRPDIATLLGTNRFLAEISLVAKLHHPHILPLLDSGETGGLPFYVMPRVEGETLRSRLQRERVLSFDAAVSIVCEVAEAISYANGRGIIHRDIKPENILLTGDHALLSDFGIARAISVATDRRLTQTGVAMGTVAYMSPEQADGAKELDERTDVYSLGCVLYEMLVGDPPFSGSNAQTILARKLAEPAPPLRTVRETVPPDVERVVLKALARAPVDRYASVAEFVSALKASSTSQLPSRRIPLRRIPARKLVTGALVLVVVTLGVLALTRAVHGSGTPAVSVRRKITTSGNAVMGSLSPDGQFLAYVLGIDAQHIMVQDLVGGSVNTVTSSPEAILSLEWAPDGSQLLVGSGGRAFLVPRLGGPKHFLGPDIFGQIEAYWIGNGSRISGHSATDHRIYLFDAKSDDTASLKVDGDFNFMNEGSWSPSGKVFALMLEWANPIRYEIRAIGLDGHNAVIASDSVMLGSPRWSADGNTLYYARGTTDLWRVSLSPTTGIPRSPPERLVQDLELYPRGFGLVHFSLAAQGHAMLYTRGERYSNLWLVDQTGTDTAGRTRQLTTGTTLRWSPVISPDGKWIAFAQETDGGAEIFKMPIDGGSADQVTFGARIRPENQIAWSPDGNQLAFSTVRGGHAQVWVANVRDSKLQRFEQTNVSSSTGLLTWAPGKAIAFERYDNLNIQLLDPASGKEEGLLSRVPLAVHSPSYSPDGSKIAFFGAMDNEGGADVIRLQDRAFSKSVRGAVYPRGWSADGRYLYVQHPKAPAILRADSRSTKKELFLQPPFREAQCNPVGATRPNTFICVAFDFVSDIWRIDNFDRN